MSSHAAFFEGLTGAGDFIARFFGRRSDAAGDKYAGSYGDASFFQAARAGNPSALRTLTSKGYGHVWKVPAKTDRHACMLA